NREELQLQDCGPLAKQHSFSVNYDLWRSVWGGTDASHPASGFLAIIRTYKRHVALSCFTSLLSFALQLVNSFVLFRTLSTFLGDPTQLAWFGWVLTVAMLVCNVIINFSMSTSWMLGASLAEKCKSGSAALVFRKSYRLKHLEDVGMVT